MNKKYVYGLKIKNGDKFAYIGCTKDPSNRIRTHLRCKSRNNELNQWIKDNVVEMLIIEECEESNWEERERYWISFYGIPNLLNIHEGGRITKNSHRTHRKTTKKPNNLIACSGIGILNELIVIRRNKKINQKDLLDNLGITQTTLSRYENGKRDISFGLLEKYADCLGYELRLMLKK